MALTPEDKQSVLTIFSAGSTVKVADEFLLLNTSESVPVKVTADVVRAYLNKGFEVTIGEDDTCPARTIIRGLPFDHLPRR